MAGGAGADHVLVASRSRNDYAGGPGVDLIDFRHMSGSLTIDLAAGTLSGFFGTTPVSGAALEFERARGTFGSDTILGTDGPNRLAGMHGGDTLWGRGGDDFLNGGPDGEYDGDDTLHGDDGFDTCVDGETAIDCEA